MALDHESKIQLADRLASDLAMQQEHRVAWIEESNRRFDAYKRGEIKAVDAKEAIARIRERIKKK